MTKEAFRLSELYGRGEEREPAGKGREERASSDQQGEVSKYLSKVSS